MVLLKTALAGIALLLIGVLTLTMLAPYATFEVQEVHKHDVEPRAQFGVGDTYEKSYSLPGKSRVFGLVAVTQPPSNQTGVLHFIVFDSDNYQKWSAGLQASSVYSAGQGQANFTFTTDKGGVYHFVFDNRQDAVYKKYVLFTVAYDEIMTSHVPDPRVAYVAWTLMGVGGLALLIGLVKKAPITWS